MDDNFYNAPGAAASSAIDNYMIRQNQEKRQALLDSLLVAKEDRQAKQDQADLEEKRASRAERAAEFAANLNERANASKENILEKRKAAHLTAIAGMLKGDVMSAKMRADDQELFGGQHLDDPKQGLKDFAATLPPDSPALPGVQAQTAGPVRFAGSLGERMAEQNRSRQQEFVNNLPVDSARKEELQTGLGAEAVGLKLPPGFFSKMQQSKTRFVFEPSTGKYYDAITHAPVTELPDGAVVDRMSDPKDTSAADASRQMTKERDLQSSREKAFTEFNAAVKPAMDRIDRVHKLEDSLNQHSDIADSTLAEQLVTLTAGGAGSGVRISQPMIDQVMKQSNTKWDQFKLQLRKWELADPKERGNLSLFFTNEQRQAMHNLAQAYLHRAVDAHKKILGYRDQINSAKSYDEINGVRSAAQKDLIDDVDTSTGSDTPAVPAKTRTRYDMNGKVIP